MKDHRFFSRTRIEALVVLGGVAGYVWENYQLPGYYRIPGIPGPTVFPLVLGIAMALAALWLFFFPDKESAEEASSPPADPLAVVLDGPSGGAEAGTGTMAQDFRSATVSRRLADQWHFYVIWALLLGYVFFMPQIGFVVASSLLLVALFLLLGERRWPLAVLLAVGFSLVIHLAFAKGLQIRLPAGILAGWL